MLQFVEWIRTIYVIINVELKVFFWQLTTVALYVGIEKYSQRNRNQKELCFFWI
jgi:hypothetical protein